MTLLDHDEDLAMVPPPTPMSEEDFLLVEGKAEWVEGVTYFMSPVSLERDNVRAWIQTVLRNLMAEKGFGEVFGELVVVRFPVRQARCPDVTFVAKSNPAVRERGRIVGVPEFLVEVVSPDSGRRDYVDKLRLYESQGVREYLIVDVIKRVAVLHRLGSGGSYERVAEQEGKLIIQSVPGFFFRPAWLTSTPLPSEYKVVREMGVQ